MIERIYNEDIDKLGMTKDKLNELIDAHNDLERRFEEHYHNHGEMTTWPSSYPLIRPPTNHEST